MRCLASSDQKGKASPRRLNLFTRDLWAFAAGVLCEQHGFLREHSRGASLASISHSPEITYNKLRANDTCQSPLQPDGHGECGMGKLRRCSELQWTCGRSENRRARGPRQLPQKWDSRPASATIWYTCLHLLEMIVEITSQSAAAVVQSSAQ